MEASRASALMLVACATLLSACPTASGNSGSAGGSTAAEGDTTRSWEIELDTSRGSVLCAVSALYCEKMEKY